MENKKTEVLKALEETSDFAKIIVFYVNKGGTGKTTLGYNFAGYCADVLGKKVLVVDGDHSCNMSNTFGVSGDTTVVDMFKTKSYKVYKTSNPLIDIIPGSRSLTDHVFSEFKPKTENLELLYWLEAHGEKINKEYDFVIVDTHNDENRVTHNLLAMSHLVAFPVTSDGDSYKEIDKFKYYVENDLKPSSILLGSKKSLIDFAFEVLPNKIAFYANNNTKITNEFLKEIEDRGGYLGIIPHRKEFEASRVTGQDVFKMYANSTPKQQEKLKHFIEHVADIFNKLIIKACEKVKESV